MINDRGSAPCAARPSYRRHKRAKHSCLNGFCPGFSHDVSHDVGSRSSRQPPLEMTMSSGQPTPTVQRARHPVIGPPQVSALCSRIHRPQRSTALMMYAAVRCLACDVAVVGTEGAL